MTYSSTQLSAACRIVSFSSRDRSRSSKMATPKAKPSFSKDGRRPKGRRHPSRRNSIPDNSLHFVRCTVALATSPRTDRDHETRRTEGPPRSVVVAAPQRCVSDFRHSGRERSLYDAAPGCGDEETRTPDPLLAKEVLYQLSYIPGGRGPRARSAGRDPCGKLASTSLSRGTALIGMRVECGRLWTRTTDLCLIRAVL